MRLRQGIAAAGDCDAALIDYMEGADRPLTDYVPLQHIPNKEEIITQWAMADVENAGLLKMDFLGLRNLTILSKAVALIEFLPGLSPSTPTEAQARSVGAALGQMHRAAQDYPGTRNSTLEPQDTLEILDQCGTDALAGIDPALPDILPIGARIVADWPEHLPGSIIHSDLFPDNVLMLGDKVTGMIDFYFAATGAMAYDLAVTHAAWCFDDTGEACDPALGAALIAG